MPLLSVIVPAYNEESNIPILVERVAKALSGIDYEINYPIMRKTFYMELIRKRYYHAHTLKIYAIRCREYASVQFNPSYRLKLFLKKKFSGLRK